MKFTILTLFPEIVEPYFTASILKRAVGKNLIEVNVINIRDYTKDKYGRVDTPPTGGGAGLILKCQPIIDAIKANSNEHTFKILLSPRGKTYNQAIAKEYSTKFDDILILCGHYEGVDERIFSYFDEILSIGDYVLTGGEIASLAIVDSVARLLPGVISDDSTLEESFSDNLLEYPQYTEPYEFEGQTVPEILYSGNHEAIKKWRRKKQLEFTREYRKDLFEQIELSKQDKKLLQEIDSQETPKWEKDAIEKSSKFTSKK